MAVTLKRRRANVSYREPSSDEDLADTSNDEAHSRKKRVVPSRRSARQRPGEVESRAASATPEDPSTKSPQRRTQRARARKGRRISYKDISSDEETDVDEDPDADFQTEEEPLVAVSRKNNFAKSRTSSLNHEPQSRKGRSRKPRALGAVLKPNKVPATERKVAEIPSDGNTPAWASLPYHVLLQIFVYASHPLHDENLKPTAAISWLAGLARMCSTFTKPALTALYRNPPIFSMRHNRKDLVRHLITPPKSAKEDYRVMVKRLELDATQMFSLTDSAHSVSDLAALVQSLTTLREIDIFDPYDRPPYRERLKRIRRWVYPAELFDALRQTQLRLRSWRWNSAFCNSGPLWIKGIHSDTAFQSLREVTLTKFHPDPARDDEENEEFSSEPTKEELLASALAVLPHLRTLSFETCGIVSAKLLPLLPSSLVSLSLVNCGELLSDALQAFLATHGSQLEELLLHHNQALDLSFLVDLKNSCPKLEVLCMDTTYYSSLVMSSDNEPLYETLLGESEIPTWPTTLRILDMEYLRNWNATSAANFFGSIIDAAEQLPWLQSITIIAMVDTDWRQRAQFRQKWTANFKKVFARPWEAPNPHLASYKAFREEREESTEIEKNDSLIEEITDVVRKDPNEIAVEDGSDSDNNAALLPIRAKPRPREDGWGSKRLRSRSKAAASYDEGTSEESESASADETSGDEALFVQGRCHRVMFRIDNFRPREEIYDEADFLDAEPSGDEEWNGNDNEEEAGYAW